MGDEVARLQRARQANEASETVIPTTFVDDAELVWRLSNQHTQEQIAGVMNWSRGRVSQYAMLKNIASEAWKIIATSIENVVAADDENVVAQNATNVAFTEGLLRSILDLTADQQLDLVSRLATDPRFSKSLFKQVAESYADRNKMKTWAREQLLLYAAQRAIGPKNLKEAEIREIARKVYSADPSLDLREIASAIGISRNRVKEHISDLVAAFESVRDVKLLKLHLLGMTAKRAGDQLGLGEDTVERHFRKMPRSAFCGNGEEVSDEETEGSSDVTKMIAAVKADITRGHPTNKIAEKHGWPEPLVWAIALEGKEDAERFKALQWGLRTWDMWNFNDVDSRFGDDWPCRIPTRQAGIVFSMARIGLARTRRLVAVWCYAVGRIAPAAVTFTTATAHKESSMSSHKSELIAIVLIIVIGIGYLWYSVSSRANHFTPLWTPTSVVPR